MPIWSRIVPRWGGEPLALVLYTRERCPLCDEMKAEIARAGLGNRCALREIDVDSDPVLVERFGRSVPVLEIEGRAAFKGRLTAEDLRRKVERALSEREPA
jgi:hypothetical protein